MGTLKLNTTSGGSLSIQAADGASDNTLTLPAVTGGNIVTTADSGTITQGMIGSGVAGSGPAFSAYANSSATISNATATKILFNTEEFDTNSNYDNVTNYRFTPTVAGYYQVNLAGRFQPTSVSSNGEMYISVYKNGSEYKRGFNSYGTLTSQIANSYIMPQVNAIVYMNGSTDYIEGYFYQATGNSQTLAGFSQGTYFQAHLVSV